MQPSSVKDKCDTKTSTSKTSPSEQTPVVPSSVNGLVRVKEASKGSSDKVSAPKKSAVANSAPKHSDVKTAKILASKVQHAVDRVKTSSEKSLGTSAASKPIDSALARDVNGSPNVNSNSKKGQMGERKSPTAMMAAASMGKHETPAVAAVAVKKNTKQTTLAPVVSSGSLGKHKMQHVADAPDAATMKRAKIAQEDGGEVGKKAKIPENMDSTGVSRDASAAAISISGDVVGKKRGPRAPRKSGMEWTIEHVEMQRKKFEDEIKEVEKMLDKKISDQLKKRIKLDTAVRMVYNSIGATCKVPVEALAAAKAGKSAKVDIDEHLDSNEDEDDDEDEDEDDDEDADDDDEDEE